MSENLLGLGLMRHADWQVMRNQMFEALDTRGQDILMGAEANCTDFDAFFDIFARARQIAPPAQHEGVG